MLNSPPPYVIFVMLKSNPHNSFFFSNWRFNPQLLLTFTSFCPFVVCLLLFVIAPSNQTKLSGQKNWKMKYLNAFYFLVWHWTSQFLNLSAVVVYIISYFKNKETTVKEVIENRIIIKNFGCLVEICKMTIFYMIIFIRSPLFKLLYYQRQQ